jgi:small subunit ribosomal protein S13
MAEFNHIVRIGDTDLKGEKNLISALRKVPGINFMLSNAICSKLNIDMLQKIGNLDSTSVDKINSLVKDISKADFPSWMLNRRKDPEEGDDIHLVTSDLKFVKGNDIKRLQKIKAYRGTRHYFKLPSRGQRTKSNFRKSKGKVMGVKRKKSSGGKAGK